MNLFSPEFFGCFLLLLYLYYTLKPKAQKFILFVASSLFIASFSIWFLCYTWLFIIVNYSFTLLLDKYLNNKKVRKIICNTSIALNILSLVFFKYVNFIIDNLNAYFNIINQNISVQALHIIVPIGISYYTFQAISYILQVYREHEKSERNIIVFSNYFIFFPKFLAGPIELSKTFIPQLKISYSFNYEDIRAGFQLILWGAFKKMIIADRLALLINGVYSDVDQFSGNPLLITFLLQPLHLYCDFSGYTDIALGIGRAFGFRLTDNFNRPFFSTSVTMFWRRWHISLSSWCNEFIFKRLSFKWRKWGIWASVYAVFITFLVVGVWHGAGWNFIILGLLQGLAINYEFFTKKSRLKIAGKLAPQLVQYSSYLITYFFICFTLIFFNAATLSDAMHFITNMLVDINLNKINIIFLTSFDKIVVFLALLFLIFIEFQQENGKNIFNEINLWPKWLRRICYYSIIALILYFGSLHKDFVYMKF